MKTKKKKHIWSVADDIFLIDKIMSSYKVIEWNEAEYKAVAR